MKWSTFASRFPRIEAMESRRLLAAQIVNGELLATGTDFADDIELRRVNNDDVRVTISPKATPNSPTSRQTFDLDDFDSIRVLGLAGNDYIHVVGNVSLPNLTLDGGSTPSDLDFDTLLSRGGRFLNGETIRDGGGRLVIRTEYSPSHVFLVDTPGNDHISLTRRNGEDFVQVNSTFAGTFVGAGENRDIASVYASGGNDTIIVGDGIHISGDGAVRGGAGNDFFDIAEGAFVGNLRGDAGDDVLFARGGPENNDYHNIGQQGQTDLGLGIDSIKMDRQTELHMFGLGAENAIDVQGTVFGDEGDNRITVRSSNTAGVTVHGSDGDDTIVGGRGPDTLLGEEGDDNLIGNDGDDLLDGGLGIDRSSGGAGEDAHLNVENGNTPRFFIDVDGRLNAYGTLGADSMTIIRTGADDVRITVNGVNRTFDMDDFTQINLYGGPGNDTISAANGIPNLFYFGRSGNDRLNGNDQLNRLIGYTGDDTLLGNDGDDHIEGGAGNDSLNGGPGNDNLNGGEGDDTLNGFAGDDDMDGSYGSDTFFARDGFPNELVRGGFDDNDDGDDIDRAQADPDDDLEGIEELLP